MARNYPVSVFLNLTLPVEQLRTSTFPTNLISSILIPGILIFGILTSGIFIYGLALNHIKPDKRDSTVIIFHNQISEIDVSK